MTFPVPVSHTFRTAARGKPQRHDRLSDGGRSHAGSHAGSGGRSGTRWRRSDRTGRAFFRSDRRRPDHPAGGDRAIRAGTTLAKVSKSPPKYAKRSEIPLLLFTYLNPALRYGFERLARDAKAAGIDGCLLTDVSVEEAHDYVKVMRDAGIDTVFLAAPTSTDHRLKLVANIRAASSIWFAHRHTGEQQSLSDTALPLIERMRALTDLPLAMGFGISTLNRSRL